MTDKIRLTAAQALVKFLAAQYVASDHCRDEKQNGT